MTRSTLLTTASGRMVDLLDPKPEDVDFSDIAEQLAKENRYNGATAGVAYSVAEHLCRGALAIRESVMVWHTGRVPQRQSAVVQLADDHAAYFLLHDCPEAYLKDDTTPKKRAIAQVAEAQFGVLASVINDAFDEVTERFDIVIAQAAGLDWPPPPEIEAAVKRFDRIMLLTEWRDLMGHKRPWEVENGIEPLPETILPWHWKKARAALTIQFAAFLPALAKRGE